MMPLKHTLAFNTYTVIEHYRSYTSMGEFLLCVCILSQLFCAHGATHLLRSVYTVTGAISEFVYLYVTNE
jgi:hypothetical protein